MKGDFTRTTFKKENHYTGVRMQQGRMMMDADWNEQQDITASRTESEALDIIGPTGAPFINPGFKITTDGADILIGAGHFYLGGVLCENEQERSVRDQPDLPTNETKPPKNPILVTNPDKSVSRLNPPADGFYLGYLDLWQRHITALEAPEIREKALGGPDTATRNKTIWQVKLLNLGSTLINCLIDPQLWLDTIKPPDGMLAAKTDKEPASKEPCSLAANAGYRRTENQLYRVEVHEGGKLGKATFKWSRDNGTVIAAWEGQDDKKLIVSTTGRDKVLNFAPGQWVELTDDYHELMGIPGTMVQLSLVEDSENLLTIEPGSATGSFNRNDFLQNPKIRRWDMKEGPINPKNSKDWIELEDGILVNFQKGEFRTGDYWLIPARTATADIEWPSDDTNPDEPKAILPQGVRHQYGKLAVLQCDKGKWSVLGDCRKIFPPVTELTNLFYVSGEGQEAMPGEMLPENLRVRVSNGGIPVLDAKVKFTLKDGGGTALTLPPSGLKDGITECSWRLGPHGIQRATAELLDCAGNPVPGQMISFNANLSIADKVRFYSEGCKNWPKGKEPKTVQDALDALCDRLQGGGTDVKAEDVSYIPGCEYLGKLEANTVQKALDELCAREQCTVSVSAKDHLPEFLFTLLRKKLDEGKKDLDICLCLLPGDHVIDQDFRELNNLLAELFKKQDRIVRIKMTGCGSGTRIHLSKAPMRLAFLASLVIRDIQVSLHNPDLKNPLIFRNIENLEISSCYFEGVLPQEVFLELGGENSDRTQLNKNVFKIYSDIEKVVPGNAIAITDATADVTICDNQIMGTVSLYGFFTQKEFELPYAQLIELRGEIKYSGSEKTIRIDRNQMTRLTISDGLIAELQKITQQTELSGLYQRCYMTENTVEAGDNAFLAQNLYFSSNSFGKTSHPKIGIAMGETTIFTGNHALTARSAMFNISSQDSAAAANPGILFFPEFPV